jgi:hypothetical protein
MQRHSNHVQNSSRYAFDFGQCRASNGWAQLDSEQDASYFGNWVNPITYETVSYCEGDVTHIRYDHAEEFRIGLADDLRWHAGRGDTPKIDGMCEPAIIAAFTRLGFANYLH